MSNWDAALDVAMEQHHIQQDKYTEKLTDLLETTYSPYNFMHFAEAINEQIVDFCLNKEKGKHFALLLKNRDPEVLEILIDISLKYCIALAGQELDNE
jgi:hypothetical protein